MAKDSGRIFKALGTLTGEGRRTEYEELVLTDIVIIRLPQGLATSCPRAFRPGTHPTENPTKALCAETYDFWGTRQELKKLTFQCLARPQAPSS